jgi:MFS family permease
MAVVRSLLGIVVGCLLVVAPWIVALNFLFEGPDKGAWVFVVGLVVLVVAAVAAGFLAAVVAGRRPLSHAAVVAGLAVLIGLGRYATLARSEPDWYTIASAFIGAVCVLLGSLRHWRGENQGKSGVS